MGSRPRLKPTNGRSTSSTRTEQTQTSTPATDYLQHGARGLNFLFSGPIEFGPRNYA
jgi:hypothetical protein